MGQMGLFMDLSEWQCYQEMSRIYRANSERYRGYPQLEKLLATTRAVANSARKLIIFGPDFKPRKWIACMTRFRSLALLAILALTIITSGCASQGGSPQSSQNADKPAVNARIDACKPGDTRVASQSQCLQDDAACYAIKDGSWCTGPRGLTCPSGSTPLKQGVSCPRGSKCFSPAAGLNCAINLPTR
jgi:hypothetical protein